MRPVFSTTLVRDRPLFYHLLVSPHVVGTFLTKQEKVNISTSQLALKTLIFVPEVLSLTGCFSL